MWNGSHRETICASACIAYVIGSAGGDKIKGRAEAVISFNGCILHIRFVEGNSYSIIIKINSGKLYY